MSSAYGEDGSLPLFYDRDAASVATAISQSFKQLTVSPVSTNAATSYADSIILADPTGGERSDALEQARRMIAEIDQPRPQITVNAWSLQMSSEDQKKMHWLVPEARRFAAGYNDALERSVTQGWAYLNAQVAKNPPEYLNAEFASYLCAVATLTPDSSKLGAFTLQTDPGSRCLKDPSLSYSLGYTDIFDRESPNLVQMMLLVMATKDPSGEVGNTLDHMENLTNGECPSQGTQDYVVGGSYCSKPFPRISSCQERDRWLYDKQVKGGEVRLDQVTSADDGKAPIWKIWEGQQPPMYGAFECTRDRLHDLLAPPEDTTAAPPKPYNPEPNAGYLGLFRAAVADFLFQNKMRAEYPDDFEPYLYPASAAKLDSALTPITEAFNEDMQALQQYLQNQLTNGIPNDKHLAYTSNGLISVSVISGNQASVATQSLNYFPQNPTMKLENFAAQLVAGAGTGATKTTPPLLGGTLSTIIPAIAAFNAAEPAQVTAKVGSGLSMTVTPYALSSDSGAELNVNVTYNENAASMISANTTQSQATDDLNSRVSEHEVSTLVRMDALKFFELSTMQSVIARQKAPYKIADPVIELPRLDGLGVFPNWRRKPDVIYNQSVIFLQASILPTAADGKQHAYAIRSHSRPLMHMERRDTHKLLSLGAQKS